MILKKLRSAESALEVSGRVQGQNLQFRGAVSTTFSLQSWESPDQPEESFGPFGPEVSWRVSDGVSPKMGVSERVSLGVSLGPFGPPGLQSVKKVSRECQKGVLTLWRHSRDTFLTLWSLGPFGARRHPVGHSLGHPLFRGHPVGHSLGHFGPEGPK